MMDGEREASGAVLGSLSLVLGVWGEEGRQPDGEKLKAES